MTPLQNWAGNYTYSAARIHRPHSLEQLQDVVANAHKVRALGTRHSFNNIADTSEDLVSLEHFDTVVALDRERQTVTVEAGMRYGRLCERLQRDGYAIHNLASLPHISVAGACATATHGSGDRNGNLATAVTAIEFVAADGEQHSLAHERDGEAFLGAVVGLGGLGVVTKLTLNIRPTFDVRQDVYENLPLAQLEQHLDAITSSAYSISMFTDWQEARFTQVWLKRLASETPSEAEPTFFGATRATQSLHPIAGISAENCTEQMGIPGPWHERLPHFRMDYTPSSGEELQTEYLVPREHAFAALCAVNELCAQIAPLLLISEIRTIAADDLWMSPCYQQPCIGIHFTWNKDWPGVVKLLPLIEAQLAPFNARPHWGKLFTLPPAQVQALYPKLGAFRALVQTYDPQGKFRNAFLDRYVFGTRG